MLREKNQETSNDMLIYRRTSVFESSAQTLVNTVNCVGVMGKGIAKEFKLREPDMFLAYKTICDRKLLEPGKLWLWHGNESWVLNFPTKIHWKNPSRLQWIEAGLEKFVAEYAERGIQEISFPLLGCGNGNLNWADVKPLMESYLSSVDIPVYIHDYTVDMGLPEHLERIAQQLRLEKVQAPSFDAFVGALRRVIEIGKGKLVELADDIPFEARMTDSGDLTITTPKISWVLEEEDLRGIWVSLLGGLVTKEKAGWAITEGAEPLLAMLSVLPQVRPVEIQRRSESLPEIAVEIRPDARRTIPAPESQGQRQLSWA